MKLKILPTHLRDKKRYLAFQAISEIPLQREDVISLIMESSGNLYGACGTSQLGLWVVKVWDYTTPGANTVKGIIRCKREEVDKARAVIPTITKYKGKRVAFQTLGISGTIKAATTNFIKLKAADE
ncbi:MULTISPECIES: Rpp14/Pop5 family protein [Methanobacterium]|jgi:ribonuclease P/MRP protein subunit POP5|uniref:Ribonuclease P protein component 2 n=1 Tax=Methanobacterium formicicum TaxID=2162 RepID=A0A089ZH41_METFO|nr:MULTISPECIES: Rpp14/Pop5 family protein [Methanobacterium]AIS32550.1 ribonuclease P subunit P14 [Methanobacterium formicicum]KUK75655.1 MAG: Ribonuclease P protein component 2 [Methanobacterium sp. 42_16]MDD4809660.1 Rpp14/Pop5 family protein [Methanobacterium formicicum]MDG3546408.1 Rpp14/Pop5 family protein [Methanobacterium formicicum]